MNREELKTTYDAITLPQEADARILRGVQAAKKPKKNPITRFAGVAAAAAVLLLAAVQIPSVSAAAKEALQQFAVWIHLDEGDIQYEEGYLTLNADAATEACRVDSLAEAADMLGISLLQPEFAYEPDNCIDYQPYVSENGILNGVILLNDFCTTGDLREVKAETTDDLTTNNSVTYRSGAVYRSPIAMQITVRSDREIGADYDNHELEYAGRQEDWSGTDAVLYEIEHLGIKAIIATVRTDGPADWQNRDGNPVTDMTAALFVYEGVEYRFLGDVSPAAMQDFLDGLTEVG